MPIAQCNEKDFRAFIDWVTQSISTQSRSLGIATPVVLEKDSKQWVLSLIKDISDACAVDENYVIINGLCRKTKLPYLMKYERMPDFSDIPMFKNNRPQVYRFTGVYAVENDYWEWSDTRVNTHTVAASMLEGGSGCPHCGAMYGLATCRCGQVFCVDGDGEVICPGCQQKIYMGAAEGDFDIARSRG